MPRMDEQPLSEKPILARHEGEESRHCLSVGSARKIDGRGDRLQSGKSWRVVDSVPSVARPNKIEKRQARGGKRGPAGRDPQPEWAGTWRHSMNTVLYTESHH